MTLKIISQSKNRMMVIVRNEGKSETRHLRLTNGKWLGVPAFTMKGHFFTPYDESKGYPSRIMSQKGKRGTVRLSVPLCDYTEMVA